MQALGIILSIPYLKFMNYYIFVWYTQTERQNITKTVFEMSITMFFPYSGPTSTAFFLLLDLHSLSTISHNSRFDSALSKTPIYQQWYQSLLVIDSSSFIHCQVTGFFLDCQTLQINHRLPLISPCHLCFL